MSVCVCVGGGGVFANREVYWVVLDDNVRMQTIMKKIMK